MAVLLCLGIGLGAFLYFARGMITPFGLALIMSYILNPAVTAVEKRGYSRAWAISLVYFGLFGVVLALAGVGVPVLLRELGSLADTLPRYTQEISNRISLLRVNFQQIALPGNLHLTIIGSLELLEASLLGELKGISDALIGLIGYLPDLLLAPFLAFYFLADWTNLGRGIINFLPVGWRPEIKEVLGQIDTALTGFIRGNLLVSLLVGTLTGFGLALVGVKYSLLLGLIMLLMDLVPYLGPFLGAIPAILIGLLDSWQRAVWALAVVVVVQQIESTILAPKILGNTTGLHPLTVIFALLLGAHWWGVPGILLSVPVVACVKIILQYLFSKIVEITPT